LIIEVMMTSRRPQRASWPGRSRHRSRACPPPWRGEHASTRAAGRLVDDVGAALVHALGGRLALVDRVEAREVRRLGEVLDVDDDVGVDRLGAGLVARLELLDEVGVDAADEADVVRLGLEGRRRADEVRALLLGEGDLVDVRAGRVGRGVVDDGELDVWGCLGGRADDFA
jgi:hypothetical protein